MKTKIKKSVIFPRIDGIEHHIENLMKLKNRDFEKEDNFLLAEANLRRALEGVFHIGAHIISRFKGARAREYKEIARNLVKLKIIPKSFEENLIQMAGYRNRITHFYSQINSKELAKIIKYHLKDFEKFIKYIKNFLKNLKKFNAELE